MRISSQILIFKLRGPSLVVCPLPTLSCGYSCYIEEDREQVLFTRLALVRTTLVAYARGKARDRKVES